MKKYIRNYLNKKNKNDLLFDIDVDRTSDDLLIIQSAPSGWSIDSSLVEVLFYLVETYHSKCVVEMGAGYSTIAFSYKLSGHLNNQIISFEENPKWFKIPESINHLIDSKSIRIIKSRIGFKFGFFGIYSYYQSIPSFTFQNQIDLVFIDGPQYFYGREGGLDHIFNALKEGCLIVMDDAVRYIDHCVMFKWLKVYQGLELVYWNESFGDKGLAILRVKSTLKRSFSLPAFSLGLYQGAKRLWNMNFGRGKYKNLN